MHKSIALTLSAFLGAALLAGCGQKSTDQPAPGGGSGVKTLKLAFLTNNAAPFWTIAHKGCDDGVKEAGSVDLDFRIPSAGSAAEQQQILDDLVAKGVDGIAMSPVDPANQTDALNKIAGQTLLVTADSDAPNSKRTCYIGTDNTAAGKEAAKLIKEALPAGGKIMAFVGSIDAQNAHDRFAGIKDELAGSNIQIIDVRTDDTDRVRAKTNVQDTLVKYPDVACLVGLWSYNGPAILNAVKEAGKAGQVKIVCFDEEEETLSGVADGTIYGTVVQQPFEFGKQSVIRMAKYLRGDKSVFPADGKLIIPTLSLKKESVAAFQAKLNGLLGK
jgi:ribose transport system substrate-binding protein